jgi:phenylacetate-CoA ligase
MTTHYTMDETRSHSVREKALLGALPAAIAAAMKAPAYAERFAGVDPTSMTSRAALATLPVLRKSDLPALHKGKPPFGGLLADGPGHFARLYMSPGPIFEGETERKDGWQAARALYAAGLRKGDVVLNTFSYHLTPGGWIFDSGARALHCAVIAAGPGNTEAQLDLIEVYRPSAYAGTPDFLKIILDAAKEKGRDASSIVRALVSGAAFPPSLQQDLKARGVDAYQAYATADVGIIAYETEAREGLVVSEDMILEIVRPGTGDPVEEGEVGEIVVTVPDATHPVIRLALGDLTAALPGLSPCGRTNMRIKGWMGRADQTAKVKGMFVRPEQVAEVLKRHQGLGRARLVVTRANEQDAMVLKVESEAFTPELAKAIAESVQAVMKLKGAVEGVAPGSLPNDGKVIADERPV